MLRPTTQELLLGLVRTIQQTMAPELSSPYAIQQAESTASMLAFAALASRNSIAHEEAELRDLQRTLASVGRLSDRLPARRQDGIDQLIGRSRKAARKSPPDVAEMEAAMSEMASALALGKLDDAIARRVRAYMHRHLDRLAALLGTATPA